MSAIHNVSLIDMDTIDDFSDGFDSLSLKTCTLMTFFTEFFIGLPLFYFLILFDKYGVDSMKRSLYNYLDKPNWISSDPFNHL